MGWGGGVDVLTLITISAEKIGGGGGSNSSSTGKMVQGCFSVFNLTRGKVVRGVGPKYQ